MWTLTALAALTLLPVGDAAADREAVVQAALDYAESYYQRDPARIERSVARELDKLGYTRGDDGAWQARPMRYEDLHGMIARLRDGDRVPPPGPKEVEVLDLLDQTALVKLTGAWGIDYMQLARDGEAWRIRHVLWQTAPEEIAPAAAADDRAGIERAVADYVDALYLAQPELIERGVDAGLVKYGYWRDDPSKPYRGMALDFAGLREMASTWNASAWLAADAPREIEVLDALDKVAAAKLTAWWGVDTMLLVRQDDGSWKVRHVLWQAHPQDA
ncbi:MAG TPA: nuclear transport factor 2 family protein [Planctomycetota bacterium]|nr:nuclear transport factor 2 family protein [Planctomycetota bacterium]